MLVGAKGWVLLLNLVDWSRTGYNFDSLIHPGFLAAVHPKFEPSFSLFFSSCVKCLPLVFFFFLLSVPIVVKTQGESSRGKIVGFIDL